MPNASVLVPYLKAPHGWMVCYEDAAGPVVHDGMNIILVRGMTHGPLERMQQQVDYVFSRIQTAKVVCIVEANYPSFRFPDATMRALLRYVDRYREFIHKIYMSRLPTLTRMGFHLAAPFLSRQLNELIEIKKSPPLHPRITKEWIESYIARRAREEDFAISAEVTFFDELLLLESKLALCGDVDAVKVFHGMKRGSGRTFGSTRWKPKRFTLTSDMLGYTDTRESTRIPYTTISSVTLREDATIRIVDSTRDYILRLDDETEQFVSILQSICTGGCAFDSKICKDPLK